MTLFICPGCEAKVKALAGSTVFHECPKRNNRVTNFKPQPK